jgi:GT2 family glycosyltransferase
MTPAPITAVIVSWNASRELPACLASLAGDAPLLREVVVVDNASSDGTPALLRERHPEVRLIETGANLGFAAGCNRGLAEVRSPFALLLNPDAELRPGALAELMRVLASQPDAALVGPRTLNADGTVQLSWGPELSPATEWRQRSRVRGVRDRDPQVLEEVERESRRPAEPDWVSGACLLARTEALDAVGRFDAGYFLYEEDVDLCLRLRRAGWRILFHPDAEVVHHLGRSAAQAPGRVRLDYQRSHLRYYRRHRGRLDRALLRGLLFVEGLGSWLRALGPGAERQGARRNARALLALALGTDDPAAA